MKLIQILNIILFFAGTAWTFVINPICQHCLKIDSSLVRTYYKPQLNVNATLFTLPGFSQARIYVDFRHLKQFPKKNNETIFQLFFETIDVVTGVSVINNINDTIIGTNQYTIAFMQEVNLVILVFIDQQYKAFQYLLRDSVSLQLSYSNNRIPVQQSSYVFLVQSQDNINLPKNKPNFNNIQNFYLQNQRIDSDLMKMQDQMESTTYWSTQDHFVVPYFPYFSNCQNQGNMMQVMQLLQNQEDCTLIPIQQTGWISEFSFGSSAHADRCTSKRTCVLTGAVQKTQYPDWQTLSTTINLFSISRQKISWQNYRYDMSFNDQDIVACIIKASSGQNTSTLYPLRVRLTIGYYQVSQTQKRIINCIVSYDLYVPSTANFSYQLQITTYPLNHTYIMLNFGFKWYVYMIVFVIIGVVGNFQNLLLWIYHYFVAEERKEIKIAMYFRIIKELLKGTLLALLLAMIIIFIVCVIMNGKIFTTTFYDVNTDGSSTTPRVIWDYVLQDEVNNYDSDDMKNLRSGRMGLAFITIGVLVILLNCHFFIGKQKQKEEYKQFQILGRIFKPLEWNRGKFLFGTFFFIALQFFFIYFAYSTLYSENIWTFIVLMKVLQVIMQQITNSVFGDILPGLPLKIITDITSYLNTISAADLYDFLFGSLIDVAVTMIQKIYIFQIQNVVVEKIQQKMEQINKFYLNLMNEDDADEQTSNYAHSQAYILQNQDQNDNQNVFIYRQAQQVQFLQQQIKQTHKFTDSKQDKELIQQTKQSQNQGYIKKKYFQALQKQYKRQRQLLFKQKQQKTSTSKNEQNRRQKGQNNQNNQNAEQQNQQKMQRQSVIFQLLLDHIAMIYTFIVNPFVVFIFWMTFYQSDLLNRYGIVYNTVILYILSALVIGFFSVINIIMIFHILQSYMGLSFQEQINDILKRFYERSTFWKAYQQQLNQKIKPQLRGADHYCLSSQLFFILTIYVGGMILVMLGMTILFKTSYNCFDDLATIPIVIFWIIVLKIFIYVVQWIAIKFDIWDYSKYFDNKNDENGTDEKNDNILGVRDETYLIEQKTNQLKIDNGISMDKDQFSKDNLLIQNSTNSKKSLLRPNSSNQPGNKNVPSIKLIQNNKNPKRKKDKKIITIQNWNAKDEVLLVHKRLQIICKKLQPLFQKQSFKRQYSHINRQFIKQNIEKILPLVSFLPELQQFKSMQLELSANAEHNKKNSLNGMVDANQKNRFLKFDTIKQETDNQGLMMGKNNAKHNKNKRHNQSSSSNSKNMDPGVAQIILQWLKATQKSKMKRINNGLQLQSKSKKCSFCYQTWGLYYGYGGACLQCSMRLIDTKRQKQKQEEQKLILTNQKRFSQLISQGRMNNRRGKTRKLNIIKEEDISDSEEELNSEGDQENERINVKNNNFMYQSKMDKKYHKD